MSKTEINILFNHLKDSEAFYVRKSQDLIKSSLEEGGEEPAQEGWHVCQGCGAGAGGSKWKSSQPSSELQPG